MNITSANITSSGRLRLSKSQRDQLKCCTDLINFIRGKSRRAQQVKKKVKKIARKHERESIRDYKDHSIINRVIRLGGLKPYRDDSNRTDLVELWSQIGKPIGLLNYRRGLAVDQMILALQAESEEFTLINYDNELFYMLSSDYVSRQHYVELVRDEAEEIADQEYSYMMSLKFDDWKSLNSRKSNPVEVEEEFPF